MTLEDATAAKIHQIYERLLGGNKHEELINACAAWTLKFGELVDQFSDAEAESEFSEQSINAWLALIEHVAKAPFHTKSGEMYVRLRARAGNQRRELRRLNKKYNNPGTSVQIRVRQNEQIRALQDENAALKQQVLAMKMNR